MRSGQEYNTRESISKMAAPMIPFTTQKRRSSWKLQSRLLFPDIFCVCIVWLGVDKVDSAESGSQKFEKFMPMKIEF